VKENLRDAVLSLYAGLTPEQKLVLPVAQALEQLAIDAQHFAVESAMQLQFIGPSSVIAQSPSGEAAAAWAMEQLKGVRTEECRFVIFGPRQSGKSTLLSLLVSFFHQKAQIASEAANYLIVPFNWSFQEMYLTDLQKLYELVVTTALAALRAARLDIVPLFAVVQQWLLGVLTSTTLPPLTLPPAKRTEPSWLKPLIEVGRRLHRYWNCKDVSWADGGGRIRQREDNNFALFIGEVAALPTRIAQAFGFSSAVFVFDHLDVADLALEPSGQFPPSRERVSLFQALWDAARESPLFAAAKDSDQLLALLKNESDDFRPLSSERIVTAADPHEVTAVQASVIINGEMCRGCPGYCAAFASLCALAEEAETRAAVKSQYSRLRSAVDLSRAELLRQEFLRLALQLAEADSDGNFDEQRMSELVEMKDLTIKVRATGAR
jgi:hypothetical protein